ncbi:MAG: hypothetical protein ACI8Q1_001493 [Parvicella sp.]|jgi:hypothetical protein
MKNSFLLILTLFAFVCCDGKVESDPDINSTVVKEEENADESMVMLQHNLEISESTNRFSSRSSLVGEWIVSRHFVRSTQENNWSQVKFTNHCKSFKFIEGSNYVETRSYFQSDSVRGVPGEYFVISDRDSTTVTLAPFKEGQIKHEIGSYMTGRGYELTWVNDSLIYMNQWVLPSNAYFLMELTRVK